MDNIIIRMRRMPPGVKGATVRDHDGDYNVYINDCLSYEEQVKTYAHEIQHIEKRHFDSRDGYLICESHVKYG